MSDITDDLIALADRVEAATGPDRELEQEIAIAAGWTHHVEQHEDDMRDDVWSAPDGSTSAWWPFYTASIDAAMQLVPEGWRWTWNGALKRAWVSSDNEAEITQHGVSAIPALALTAASLRARAAA